jgi:hypothetical protein
VALCQARTSTKPLWGLSSSNPYHPSHVPNRGGHTRLREREGGVVPIRRGDRHWGTLGIYVLCSLDSQLPQKRMVLGDLETRVNSFGSRVTFDGTPLRSSVFENVLIWRFFATFFSISIRVLRQCREERGGYTLGCAAIFGSKRI